MADDGLTPELVRKYTDLLRAEWDGKGMMEPAAAVCPRCGVIIEGSDGNVELHLKWHRTAERDILSGLF